MPSTVTAEGMVTPEPTRSTSAPSIKWRRHVIDVGQLISVAKDSDRFIAIRPTRDPDRQSVLASADGLTWKVLVADPFDGQGAASIAYVADRYLVVGFRNISPEWSEPHLWTSLDGRRWSVWAKWPDIGGPRSILKFRDRWLEVDDYKQDLLGSPDGRNWATAIDFGLGSGTQLVKGPAGALVGASREAGEDMQGNAVQSEAWSHITTNGSDWTQATIATLGGVTLDRVGANDSGYVALGRGRWTTAPFVAAAWWSPDGRDWTAAELPAQIQSEEWFVDQLEVYQGGFLATAQPPSEGPPRFLWSVNGRTWAVLDGGPDAPLGSTSLIIDSERILLFGQEDARTPDVSVVWEGRPEG